MKARAHIFNYLYYLMKKTFTLDKYNLSLTNLCWLFCIDPHLSKWLLILPRMIGSSCFCIAKVKLTSLHSLRLSLQPLFDQDNNMWVMNQLVTQNNNHHCVGRFRFKKRLGTIYSVVLIWGKAYLRRLKHIWLDELDWKIGRQKSNLTFK